jgi:hypothetical protein
VLAGDLRQVEQHLDGAVLLLQGHGPENRKNNPYIRPWLGVIIF